MIPHCHFFFPVFISLLSEKKQGILFCLLLGTLGIQHCVLMTCPPSFSFSASSWLIQEMHLHACCPYVYLIFVVQFCLFVFVGFLQVVSIYDLSQREWEYSRAFVLCKPFFLLFSMLVSWLDSLCTQCCSFPSLQPSFFQDVRAEHNQCFKNP